jgi:proteasome assembly chaperone (PAC2) family protein
MENNNINWLEKPHLNRPYLIMAFSGWGNAGDVASSVMWYLLSRLEATLFAELKGDKFYVCPASGGEIKRPVVVIEDGLIKNYNPVNLNFWYHRAAIEAERDIILVSGPEPEMNWNEFVATLIDLASEFAVEEIIALGGSFDSIPHTEPPRITGVANRFELKADLIEQGIEPVNYKGPSSIHSLLMLESAKKDIPMLSLWTHTPHYIQVVNFMGCYHVMLKLNALLGLNIDLEVARKDSEFLLQQIDQAIEKKPELQSYFKTLQSEFKKESEPPAKPINQNIIKEIEDLLKDN